MPGPKTDRITLCPRCGAGLEICHEVRSPVTDAAGRGVERSSQRAWIECTGGHLIVPPQDGANDFNVTSRLPRSPLYASKADVAEWLGVRELPSGRESRKRFPGFPEPVTGQRALGPLWAWTELETWAASVPDSVRPRAKRRRAAK